MNIIDGDSTRVSNELGGGNPEAARVAVWVAMVVAVTEAVVVSAALFGCRNILGYAYSDDSHVVKYVAAMTPLLCVSIFMDSLQAVLSGLIYPLFFFFFCIYLIQINNYIYCDKDDFKSRGC